MMSASNLVAQKMSLQGKAEKICLRKLGSQSLLEVLPYLS